MTATVETANAPPAPLAQLFFYSFKFRGSLADDERTRQDNRLGDITYLRQLQRSIASLRRHNRTVAIALVLFDGTLPTSLAAQFADAKVRVLNGGSYEEALGPYCGGRSRALCSYPTSHKWLSLAILDTNSYEQVVYLDSDTYFVKDPAPFFARHQTQTLFAREEPFTRLSPFGYDSSRLNEDSLAALAEREGVESIKPFNTGVVVLNRSGVAQVLECLPLFFQMTMRFIAWMHVQPHRQDFPLMIEGFQAAERAGEHLSPLPYPADDAWIVDQLGMWLALGSLSSFELGLLPATGFAQGPEFLSERWSFVGCHYYTGNEQAFLQRLAHEEDHPLDEDWLLEHLRASQLVLNEGVELTLHWAVRQRGRSVQRGQEFQEVGLRLAHWYLGTVVLGTDDGTTELPRELVMAACERGILTPPSLAAGNPEFECEVASRPTDLDDDDDVRAPCTWYALQTDDIVPQEVGARTLPRTAGSNGDPLGFSHRRPVLWTRNPFSSAYEPYWLSDAELSLTRGFLDEEVQFDALPASLRASLRETNLAVSRSSDALGTSLGKESWQLPSVLSLATIRALASYLEQVEHEGFFEVADARSRLDRSVVLAFYARQLTRLVSNYVGHAAQPVRAPFVRYLREGLEISGPPDQWLLAISLESQETAIAGPEATHRLRQGEALLVKGLLGTSLAQTSFWCIMYRPRP